MIVCAAAVGTGELSTTMQRKSWGGKSARVDLSTLWDFSLLLWMSCRLQYANTELEDATYAFRPLRYARGRPTTRSGCRRATSGFHRSGGAACSPRASCSAWLCASGSATIRSCHPRDEAADHKDVSNPPIVRPLDRNLAMLAAV